LESLRERLVSMANLNNNAGRALFGGLGGSATPFVDQYGSPTGVMFDGQRGQAATGETSLPQTLDGHAIWMSVPQGNGHFTVGLDAANSGSVFSDVGQVTDASVWATGSAYTVEFAVSAGVTTYTVLDSASNPVPGHQSLP